MKIRFKNGTEIEYLSAIETEEFYNSASRRTLTFECAPAVISIDALNVILSLETNLKDIVLINEQSNVQNVYTDYVLKLQLSIISTLVDEKTNTYADKLVFKLGKRTYIEQKLHDLGI